MLAERGVEIAMFRLVFCGALVLGTGASAFGSEPTPGAATQPAPKREREKRAHDAFLRHRYNESLGLLTGLYAEFHDPVELRNIGRCYQMMREPAPAIASFKEYLARAHDLSRGELLEVQGFIREMEALGPSPDTAGPTPGTGPPPPSGTARNPVEATPPSPAVAAADTSLLPQELPQTLNANSTPTASTAEVVHPPPTVTLTRSPDGGPRSTMLIAGIALGATGLIAVGVGSIYGLAAKSKNDDSKQYCFAGNACTQAGKDLRDTALSDARLSTISFVAGGALLAAGLVLVLRSPPVPTNASRSPTTGVARLDGFVADLGARSASLSLRGRF